MVVLCIFSNLPYNPFFARSAGPDVLQNFKCRSPPLTMEYSPSGRSQWAKNILGNRGGVSHASKENGGDVTCGSYLSPVAARARHHGNFGPVSSRIAPDGVQVVVSLTDAQ